MKKCTFCFGICFIVTTFLYLYTTADIHKTFAITRGVAFYHFFIRLLIGTLFDILKKEQLNVDIRYFKQRKIEPTIYSFLRVKKWKNIFHPIKSIILI